MGAHEVRRTGKPGERGRGHDRSSPPTCAGSSELSGAGCWISVHVGAEGTLQGSHACVVGWKGTARQNATRNHRAGPNTGNGNTGSIFDSESPQNTMGVQELSPDPKKREEVSRVSAGPRSQALPPPPLRPHDEQADARPGTPPPRGPQSQPGRPMTWRSSSRGSEPCSH